MYDQDMIVCHGAIDAVSLFSELPFEKLYLQDPRQGCAARAQIIVDWLKAKKLVAGRLWALPAESGKTINAPLKDVYGNHFPALPWQEEKGIQTSRMAWKYHVAATAQTDTGIVVFDPGCFDGPVEQKIWENIFDDKSARFLALRHDQAPLYGLYGSCYSPELAQEHWLDDHQTAQLDLSDIKAGIESPDFDIPFYRPIVAPCLKNRYLLTKTR